MINVENVKNEVIEDITNEINSLVKYGSTNSYVARLVSDRITSLLIRVQEIADGNNCFL